MAKSKRRLSPAERLRRLEWDYQALIAGRPSPLVREQVTCGLARVQTFRQGRARWRRIEWRGEVLWERAT